MKTEPNEPAQPNHTMVDGELSVDPGKYGLTKREYFAAMAMQGMLVNGAQTEHGAKSLAPSTIAYYAAITADELIKALNL